MRSCNSRVSKAVPAGVRSVRGQGVDQTCSPSRKSRRAGIAAKWCSPCTSAACGTTSARLLSIAALSSSCITFKLAGCCVGHVLLEFVPSCASKLHHYFCAKRKGLFTQISGMHLLRRSAQTAAKLKLTWHCSVCVEMVAQPGGIASSRRCSREGAAHTCRGRFATACSCVRRHIRCSAVSAAATVAGLLTSADCSDIRRQWTPAAT